MSFSITTDTSANLENRHIKANDITVVPFTYYYDNKEYTCLDTESFNGDEFYDMIRKGTKVTTSQVTPQTYIDCFEPHLKAGKDIIHVSMSSGISGSCNSAQIAANQLKLDYPRRQIKVIDTLAASLGEGLVALKAAVCRVEEMGFDKTVELLTKMSRNMCQIFTVDDLMHLRRGGRLSPLSAVLGTVLNIKPLLRGNHDGTIVAFSKVRGRKKSIEAIAERYDRLVKNPAKQIVGIAQAGCREDAEYLKSLLQRNNPPLEVMTVEYEPVTGSHVGPGALALFFESDERSRAVE